jgi:hypothetical protein
MVHSEIVFALHKYRILIFLILWGISNISLHDISVVGYTLVLMSVVVIILICVRSVLKYIWARSGINVWNCFGVWQCEVFSTWSWAFRFPCNLNFLTIRVTLHFQIILGRYAVSWYRMTWTYPLLFAVNRKK